MNHLFGNPAATSRRTRLVETDGGCASAGPSLCSHPRKNPGKTLPPEPSSSILPFSPFFGVLASLLGCCIAFQSPVREKTRPARAVGLVLFSFLLLVLFPGVCGAKPVDLTILHVNDVHGHILPFNERTVHEQETVSGAAALAAMIQQERERNPQGTLLLSAGDMFQGAPISTVFHGKPVLDIMNHVRFDAMTLGNHEFDWGRDVLGELTTAARFPFLSANLKDREGRYLPGVKPYVLFTRKGIRIGVAGVTTGELAFRTKPSNVADLTVEDPAAVLPAVLQEMKNQGAQLLVVLSHCGLQADMDLAVEVPGIHVIVGGDSHTVLPDPMKVGETVIVQAGYYGMYLGVLDLSFDPSTSRVARTTEKGELKPVLSGPDRPEDPQVAAMIREFETRFDAKFNQAIGQTAVDLLRQRHAESNFGNLVTDAMREATGAQIAFQNGGGIRTDLYTGPVTLGQMYSALPFDNYLVLMDLTGKQILELLEQSATLAVHILQVSGLKVAYDLSRPPGNRVVEALVGTRPVEEQAVYRVVTNDFLAAGGDRFTTFKEGKNVTARESLRDLVIDYVAQKSPVAPVTEGRITFKTP